MAMRILLTNDDGIRAPGIAAMHGALAAELAPEIAVIAPETVQSATGHGITLEAPLLTRRVIVTDPLGPFEGTSVEGRPADCVKLAIQALLPWRPDLVVSGMNSGANVGINVLYSGTVAAALEAAFLGLPAIAVSLLLRRETPTEYGWAARIAAGVIRDLVAIGLTPGRAISINVPALPAGTPPAGVRLARQCTRPWTDTYDRRQDPRGRDYYWNTAVFTLGETDADTDVAALREGYVTVTPLMFDLTDHTLLERLAGRLKA